MLFGGDAVSYRLNDSGARVLITDKANYDKVDAVRGQCPSLEKVVVIDGEPEGSVNFWKAIEGADERFENVRTRAEDIAPNSTEQGPETMPAFQHATWAMAHSGSCASSKVTRSPRSSPQLLSVLANWLA